MYVRSTDNFNHSFKTNHLNMNSLENNHFIPKYRKHKRLKAKTNVPGDAVRFIKRRSSFNDLANVSRKNPGRPISLYSYQDQGFS